MFNTLFCRPICRYNVTMIKRHTPARTRSMRSLLGPAMLVLTAAVVATVPTSAFATDPGVVSQSSDPELVYLESETELHERARRVNVDSEEWYALVEQMLDHPLAAKFVDGFPVVQGSITGDSVVLIPEVDFDAFAIRVDVRF